MAISTKKPSKVSADATIRGLINALETVRMALDMPVQHSGTTTPGACIILRTDARFARNVAIAAIIEAEKQISKRSLTST